MAVAKLTKKFVDSLPFNTGGGKDFYHDSDLPGFGVYVGQQTKTYFAQAAVRGKTVRVKIGRHGLYSPEEARRAARELLLDMSKGINPNKQKKADRAQQITIEQVFKDYVATRNLKPRTVDGYEKVINGYLKDWKRRALIDISREDIRIRHARIGKKHGHAGANKAMRLLRGLFNFADATHNLGIENPVKYLSLVKGWYPEKRRQSVIKPSQLPAWYKAVMELENINYRDLFLLILFTGLRRNEATQMKWEHVDFKERTFTIPETKNGDALTLPMSDFVHDLLQQRSGIAEFSPYVFPGKGKDGYFKEPKKGVYKVIEASGVPFTVHDLRRSYITIAESLNFSNYTIKRLVNHRISDVTGGYVIMDVERLRAPAQEVADKIQEYISA